MTFSKDSHYICALNQYIILSVCRSVMLKMSSLWASPWTNIYQKSPAKTNVNYNSCIFFSNFVLNQLISGVLKWVEHSYCWLLAYNFVYQGAKRLVCLHCSLCLTMGGQRIIREEREWAWQNAGQFGGIHQAQEKDPPQRLASIQIWPPASAGGVSGLFVAAD